ncbi:MAG: 6-phosphofructokinase [Spirochaetaceae bacterium]|nr:6-phosphofructokinase [Spirochaetaceae bacterium]MCF7947386.1 6-phosphofructokinase [Spirochaetia bacterium]MCF7950322.1 6-phosphofructokinase [Spirochaetaceae bacterium]
MQNGEGKGLAILTSGGDAQGMNPAVRAVVRTAIKWGFVPYGVFEGYQGLVDGGDYIQKLDWGAVGGILHRGGTVLGSARSKDFREKEGLIRGVRNLVERDITNLIVIGGDGSLSGANEFRSLWPEHLDILVERGEISPEQRERNRHLKLVGLVGSIDNDMFGSDMTIGAASALHRITEAIDAITATASSHQRAFVIEVMGRNCGYLALMSALAAGVQWVLIPENPPDVENWEDRMVEVMKEGRDAGRRYSIAVVAEGARDRNGTPISAEHVVQVLKERLTPDTRLTILGHVQRGGTPCAFDRYMSTMQGYKAVETISEMTADDPAQLIGLRRHSNVASPLMDCVQETRSIKEIIEHKEYAKAMKMRGGSFADSYDTFRTLISALPRNPVPEAQRLRIGVMHGGPPAPGMNTAVRAAVRIGIDNGHQMYGVHNGFEGLIKGDVSPMDWMSVDGWASQGGSELGTNRRIPTEEELPIVARHLRAKKINGLLMIGGWDGYAAAHLLHSRRDKYPEFNIPIICLPATINNNLPGSELSVGSDTALNTIMEAVDKIKHSAVASRRVFVVEVMGRNCGYLALLSALSTGAERAYLHEEGVSLKDLQEDIQNLVKGFERGKRLGLMIRNENVNEFYTADFMRSIFEQEGQGLYDVRRAILGHQQNGGDPSPFDRIQATRLAKRSMEHIFGDARKSQPGSYMCGLVNGQVRFNPLNKFYELGDGELQRPTKQWWLKIRPVATTLASEDTPLDYTEL